MGNYFSSSNTSNLREELNSVKNLFVPSHYVYDLEKQIESLKTINQQQKQEIQKLASELEKHNDTNNISKDTVEDDQSLNLTVSMAKIEKIVDEMLADDNINVGYLPDIVEKQLYLNVIRIALNIVNKTIQTTKIDVLDHQIGLKFGSKV